MSSGIDKISSDTAFIVVSCDKYSDLWGPFFKCFAKYWPDCPFDKYLVSNHQDFAEEGLDVLKIGEDMSYSDNLRLALSKIDHEWVILWLDDVFVSRQVNTNRLLHILDYAKHIGAGYLKLAADMPMAYVGDLGEEIGPLPKGIKYRSAIGVTFYRKTTLLNLLTPNSNAWELDRSDIADTLDEPFYALTPRASKHPPIGYVHLLVKGRWLPEALPFLRKEEFTDLIKLRETQTLGSVLYAKLYLARLSLLRLLKIYWR